MSREDWQQMFQHLPVSLRVSFCEMSMIEFTSLMRYILNGNTHPWPLLSSEAVHRHVCLDFRAYLDGVEDTVWRAHLPAYGWLVLTDPEHVHRGECTEAQASFLRNCAEAFQRCNLPGHAWASFFAQDSSADRRAEPEDVNVQTVKTEPVEPPNKKIKQEPLEAISARELEAHLTKGSLCKAPGRERCDLAQVAYGVLPALGQGALEQAFWSSQRRERGAGAASAPAASCADMLWHRVLSFSLVPARAAQAPGIPADCLLV